MRTHASKQQFRLCVFSWSQICQSLMQMSVWTRWMWCLESSECLWGWQWSHERRWRRALCEWLTATNKWALSSQLPLVQSPFWKSITLSFSSRRHWKPELRACRSEGRSNKMFVGMTRLSRTLRRLFHLCEAGRVSTSVFHVVDDVWIAECIVWLNRGSDVTWVGTVGRCSLLIQMNKHFLTSFVVSHVLESIQFIALYHGSW